MENEMKWGQNENENGKWGHKWGQNGKWGQVHY